MAMLNNQMVICFNWSSWPRTTPHLGPRTSSKCRWSVRRPGVGSMDFGVFFRGQYRGFRKPCGSKTGSALPIGSMVLLYMVTWIPSIYPSHVKMLAYIPAPWILWVIQTSTNWCGLFHIFVDPRWPTHFGAWSLIGLFSCRGWINYEQLAAATTQIFPLPRLPSGSPAHSAA